MLMYEGNDGLLNNVNRYKVLFHAQRGIPKSLTTTLYKRLKPSN